MSTRETLQGVCNGRREGMNVRPPLTLVIMVVALVLGCAEPQSESEAPAAAATAAPSATQTVSPTATHTPGPTATRTSTPTASPTLTPVPTAKPPPPPIPTATASPTTVAAPAPSATQVGAVPPPASTPTAAQPLEVAEGTAAGVLQAAQAAMSDVEFLHFDMQLELNLTDLNLVIPMTLVGEVQAPDRSRATLTVMLGFFEVETEVINIADTTYAKDFTTGEWQVSEAEVPFLSDPTVGISSGAFSVEELKLTEEVDDDGTPLYRVQGVAPSGFLSPSSGEFDIALWIGVEDRRLRRIVAQGDFVIQGDEAPFLEAFSGSSGTLSVIGAFSDYGAPVSIEPPELDT